MGPRNSRAAGTASARGVESGHDLSAPATRVMKRLCTALGAVFSDLPGRPERATDLANVLGVASQLAWQVFRMARSPEPLAAVQYLPTSNQLARVLEAARGAGADERLVEIATKANVQLDEFIRVHAKDRREFESLAGSLAAGTAEQVDLKHRRALHRGNSHFYGVQARTVYACVVEHPAPQTGGYQTISMLGYVGLHPLRPNVPITVVQGAGTVQFHLEEEAAARVQAFQVYRPRGATYLVDGFGPGPTVELAPAGVEDGRLMSRVVLPGIGRRSAVSFMSATEYENPDSASNPDPGVGVQLLVPAETLVMDVLFPSEWTTSGHATVTTYARRGKPDKVDEFRSVDIVATSDRVMCRRRVSEVPACADVPGITETIHGVLRAKGWDGTKFDVYRCRVAYPVLHAMVLMGIKASKEVEVPE